MIRQDKALKVHLSCYKRRNDLCFNHEICQT
jgi:hypothetical protein